MKLQRKMRTIQVRRTHLVRRVQVFKVDIPAEYDTDEWMVNDFGGFHDYVVENGELLKEKDEQIDDDLDSDRDLDLEVIA